MQSILQSNRAQRRKRYTAAVSGCLLAFSAAASPRLPEDLPKSQLDWQPDAKRRCQGFYQAPPLDLPEAEQPLEQARLFADADQLLSSVDQGLHLKGQVRLRLGTLSLQADQAWVNAERTQARLEGQLELRQKGLLLRARQGAYDLETGHLQTRQAHYLLHDQHLRGAAWQLEQLTDGRVRLQEASMTRCAPESNAWRLVAGRLELDPKSGFGDAYHVRLQIQEVPVFYWPWLRFPLDDQRHTGFLFPTLSYSVNSSSLDFIQPFYWNLAPNYDATFWPRYLSKRGAMLGMQGRYQHPSDRGHLFYARLERDALYDDQHRWHFAARHQGQLPGSGLSYGLDFSQASDPDYFDDLGQGPFAASEDLLQSLFVHYRWPNWQARLQMRGYQMLDSVGQPETAFELFDLRSGRDAGEQDYFQLPQLEVRGHQPLGEHWQAGLLLDWTHFDKLFDSQVSAKSDYLAQGITPFPENPERFYVRTWGAPQAQRWVLEPRLEGDWRWPWVYIRPSVRLRHTGYDLQPYWPETHAAFTAEQLAHTDRQPDFTVPIYSLDTGLFFERDTQLFGQPFLQTLEPRLFAAYIPYVEQYAIPQVFDGRFRAFDINQLYRAERTQGRDRVGDVQKVTLGLTQRFLQPQSGRETFSLAVARAFYFADRQVTSNTWHPDDPRHPKNQERSIRPYAEVRDTSNWALQARWQLNDALQLRSTLLWDDYFHKTDQSHTRLTYTHPSGLQLNLGHSYTSYYQHLDLQGPTPERSLLEAYSYDALAQEQAYLSGVLPLPGDRWRFFFRYAQDWKWNESLDQLAGMEYTACCWQLQLVYRDWIQNPGTFPAEKNAGRARDRAFFVQLTLRGLGGAGQSNHQLLSEKIPGYAPRNFY